MNRTTSKTIIFEGTKIANLDELFSKANGLYGDGWQDCQHNGLSFSQRIVSGWLEEEDSVIVCPSKDTNVPAFGTMKQGLWYRYHGRVSVSETFSDHLRYGQHLIVIQPLHSAFDIVESDEEPEGRKDRYKDFPNYVRDSMNQITVSAP